MDTKHPMKSLTEADIRTAIEYASTRSNVELRDELRAHQSVKYRLIVDSREYEAKVIIQLAWVLKYPDAEITATSFRGDRARVATPLRELGFDVIEISSDRRFGEIDGIAPGSTFAKRIDLSKAQVHRPPEDGISGSAKEGADSIVLSGGYVDDKDYGDRIIYTGRGGRDRQSGRQIADQELEGKNLALAVSCDQDLPVRVIRGAGHDSPYSPDTGFRYDGLFRVVGYQRVVGVDGFWVWRFELIQLSGDLPARRISGDGEPASSVPEGSDKPRRHTVGPKEEIERNYALAMWVKQVHDWTCQMCDERITTPTGGYAEAAHIIPLGSPHYGLDQASNLLCLCPNCHKRFDKLSRFVDENGNVIDVLTGDKVAELRRHVDHNVSPEHLAAHEKRARLDANELD